MRPPQPQVHEDVTYQVIADGTGAAGRGRVAVVTVSSASGSQHRRAAADVHRGSVAPHCGLSCEQASGQGGGRAGSTYRPRSVSSLLMRLRAMAMRVVWAWVVLCLWS
jgi:hypothetical protein